MEKGKDVFQTPETAVGKSKVRLVPDVYFLPRRSIPRTIALYTFLTAAGIGAGMLVEQWIKQQVENDTAILWRKEESEVKKTDPAPTSSNPKT